MLRPGRLDSLIYIGLPDYDARRATFKASLRKSPMDPDVDFGYFADKTEGFSGADIAGRCNHTRFCQLHSLLSINSLLSITFASINHLASVDHIRFCRSHSLLSITFASVNHIRFCQSHSLLSIVTCLAFATNHSLFISIFVPDFNRCVQVGGEERYSTRNQRRA
jgi:hypothetical protein